VRPSISDRIEAIRWLADRGWGKARDIVDIDGETRRPFKIVLSGRAATRLRLRPRRWTNRTATRLPCPRRCRRSGLSSISGISRRERVIPPCAVREPPPFVPARWVLRRLRRNGDGAGTFCDYFSLMNGGPSLVPGVPLPRDASWIRGIKSEKAEEELRMKKISLEEIRTARGSLVRLGLVRPGSRFPITGSGLRHATSPTTSTFVRRAWRPSSGVSSSSRTLPTPQSHAEHRSPSTGR